MLRPYRLKKILAPRLRLAFQNFTTTTTLSKDEKSKQLLKTLGMNLQKGKIQKEDTPVVNVSNANNDQKNIMNQYYDTISHMTSEDLHIQLNLDEGRQLFLYPSDHFLNRKQILRSLPNEIDIFDKNIDLDDIYYKLSQLDKDETVHMKYFKRYLVNYYDPIVLLLQKFNGIDKKFKLLRRKEIDNLSLSVGSYLYHENLFNLPYNVVGFDRSITGLPLTKNQSKLYPQEFIEDLQMFRKKIPVHKRDLDFIEFDEMSKNIDPSNLNKNSLKSFINELNLLVPENSILIDSVDNYQTIDLNQNIVFKLEQEILNFKKSLQTEIEYLMQKNGVMKSILLFSSSDLKFNNWKLYEKFTNNHDNLFIINYRIKHFNPIPNYALILRLVHQKPLLKKYLLKLFIINLQDQIELLIKLKYYRQRDSEKFMKKTINSINNIIKFKLVNLFKPILIPGNYDALIYCPYKNSPFKRIYWLRNITINKKRKSAIRIKWKQLDELIEY